MLLEACICAAEANANNMSLLLKQQSNYHTEKIQKNFLMELMTQQNKLNTKG
jgi:hypothetical protein